MSDKSKVDKLIEGMLVIAKIGSFLSLTMSLVIKTRMLLGVTNNLEHKKKEFLDKKKKEVEDKKIIQEDSNDDKSQ